MIRASLGYYFGFPSDFDATSYGDLGQAVAWWKANNPTWIEYQCDTNGNPTVPAKIGGEGDVILDLANPAVLTYQVNTLSAYITANPLYNAISLDTLDLSNAGNACGHYNSSGTFVLQYFQRPLAFEAMAVSWTQAFVTKMHALSPPVGVIANNVPESEGFGYANESALLDSVRHGSRRIWTHRHRELSE